ncbi:GyrI-like domain-containing protein [Chloroflexota bacterium]
MDSPIEVRVKEIGPMTVAFLDMTGSFSQMPDSFGRLYSWIDRNGYKGMGPSMAVFHNIPGQVPEGELKWELRSQLAGVVPEKVPGENEPGVKKIGSVTMATYLHRGPYEAVEPVYTALENWIRDNGYEISGAPEELYYDNPAETGKEPTTEIRFPIKKTA